MCQEVKVFKHHFVTISTCKLQHFLRKKSLSLSIALMVMTKLLQTEGYIIHELGQIFSLFRLLLTMIHRAKNLQELA